MSYYGPEPEQMWDHFLSKLINGGKGAEICVEESGDEMGEGWMGDELEKGEGFFDRWLELCNTTTK